MMLPRIRETGFAAGPVPRPGTWLPLVAWLLLIGCSQPAEVPDITDTPRENWSYGYGGSAGDNLFEAPDPIPCYVYAPYDYSSAQGWPLLLYLHDGQYPGYYDSDNGWSGNAEGEWTQLASAEGFLFAVPGVREYADLEHTWAQETSAHEIDGTIDRITQNFNVDLDHLHIVGAGWGGHAAERFAFSEPGDIATFGVHNAGLDPEDAVYPDVAPKRRAPFYITHHPYDALIDIQNSLDLEETLLLNDHEVEFDDDLGEIPGQNHRFTPHIAAMHWDMARAKPYVE